MKKTIFTMALAALMLAGCSQEESLPTGEEVKMTFTANLSTGIQSRADGEDIVSVDKLICAVCKQTGEGETASLSDVLIRDTVEVDKTTGKATFTPTLLKGYKYGIVFWAYNSQIEDPYFDTSNLAQIKFTPKNSPMGNHYEVYTETITDVSTSTSGDALKVTLKRPLAQINIATTLSDWENVEKLQTTPATSTITLAGCSNVYNALNKTYTGNETFTYTINLSKDTGLSDTAYILLGSGYTFPECTPECSISVMNDAEEPAEIYSATMPNLPTDGNYRTNIIPGTKTDEAGNEVEGGLMTGSVSYEVTISEGYTKTVSKTPEELEEANQNNQENNE